MCGIAGVVSADGSAPPRDVLSAMSALLVHRGPDEEGTFVGEGAALAMRRLSILDLTPGQLPITNEDGRIVVVFNGEIYNFRELRQELEAAGHRFRTRTDTEVIVHLYEQCGLDFVERLRGMFGIALWDRTRRRLCLARDRLGKKPLFYMLEPGRLRFGSEIKAIFGDPAVRRDVDPRGLLGLLTLGYTPAPGTFWKDVRELRPGHVLVYEEGRADERAFWRPPEPQERLGPADPEAELEELVDEAVRLRLVSDVPLGVFLSGGVDSSLVVASMAHLGHTDIKTFSISFDDPRYDEVSFARVVARRFGTDHREFVVGDDLFSTLPLLVWHHDGPFADSSAIPTYFLCKLAREHVTVALTGDGGDEAFGGYDTYRAHSVARLWASVPAWMRRRLLRPVLARLPQGRSRSLVRQILEVDRVADAPLLQRHARWVAITKPETLARLVGRGPLAQHAADSAEALLRPYFEGMPVDDPVAAATHVDLRTSMVGAILEKVDRASMAVSLEARSPLLDHRVVEFACRLPGDFKVRRLLSKALLKRVASRRLSRAIVYRTKQGFRVPVAEWFRGRHRDFVRDALLARDSLATAYFDRAAVTDLVEAHAAGRHDHSRELFTLLTVEMARDTFARPGPIASRPADSARSRGSC